MGRGSETQLQVSENLSRKTLRIKITGQTKRLNVRTSSCSLLSPCRRLCVDNALSCCNSFLTLSNSCCKSRISGVGLDALSDISRKSSSCSAITNPINARKCSQQPCCKHALKIIYFHMFGSFVLYRVQYITDASQN